MPKFVIERDLPGAGKLTPAELQAISQKSVEVLDSMAGRAQWLQSYVTDDKLFCVYIAPGEDPIRQHAQQGRFPANRISEIKRSSTRRLPRSDPAAPGRPCIFFRTARSRRK